MTKIFVSLPMNGKTNEAIHDRIEELSKYVLKIIPRPLSITTGFDIDDSSEQHTRLWYLGRAIQQLSNADMALFDKDWKTAKGCVIEHEVCVLYHIPILYETELDVN